MPGSAAASSAQAARASTAAAAGLVGAAGGAGFGAAQAVAYAAGTMAGAVGVDVARTVLGSPVRGYLTVFAVEAVLFAASAALALRSASSERASTVMQQRGDMLHAALHS